MKEKLEYQKRKLYAQFNFKLPERPFLVTLLPSKKYQINKGAERLTPIEMELLYELLSKDGLDECKRRID